MAPRNRQGAVPTRQPRPAHLVTLCDGSWKLRWLTPGQTLTAVSTCKASEVIVV
jgi:hypothetical protein